MKGFVNNLFLLFISLFILSSCSEELKSFNSDTEAYTNSFSKGPISLDLIVDKTEISTNQNIKVLLEGKASEGWKPSFPELPKNLDKFTVISVSDTPSHLEDDGSLCIGRTILLKPFLSGDYEVPPLSMDYIDQDNNKGVLLSTPVSVSVTSLLPENTENLQLKEIREPNTFNYWKMIIIVSIALFILGGFFLVFLLIRKGQKETPEIPPYEEAFNKLTLLLDKKLPEEGRFKEFYFQLNLIVRVYIEKQFSIRAPEQTTEEFLQDLAISNNIADEFKQSLKEFLIHSDLVKFARHKPENDELSDSVESCKNFIKVTGEIL